MKQHLHNKIGNIIGERKRELYTRLKSGADLEKEIDAFMTDLSAELQSIVPPESFPDAIGHVPVPSVPRYSGDEPPPANPPRRDRNALADAIAEIISNDFAPPRLRDAVCDYVTDAPEKIHSESEQTATATTFPELTTQLPRGRESWELIERLAQQSLADGESGQHMALLELLTYLMHDSTWALAARNAVISASGELRDEAADILVALAQQQRTRTVKGGEK